MKLLRWILGIFLLLNLVFIGISFFLPGQLAFVDSYSIRIEKSCIDGVERLGSIRPFRNNKPDPYTANAMSLSELTGYLDEIKPGTLFFTIHGKAAGAIFIKGNWKHCGIYIGSMEQLTNYWGEDHEAIRVFREYYTSGDEYLIFDSSYDHGVAIHNINEMADLSGSSTLRTLLLLEYNLNKDDWSEIILDAVGHSGKDYDYCYVLNEGSSFYCAELLYNILPLEKDYFKPSQKILGREFLLPSDLLQSIYAKGIPAGDFSVVDSISTHRLLLSP